MQFKLSAPTKETFFVSVGLAVIAVVFRVMAVLDIEIFQTGGYLLLLIAYLVLLVGTLLRGV